jgi:hypothetical protein
MSTDQDQDSALVAYADVDDVIEAAARAKEQRVDALSVEELQEVAAELDIPADLVEPAIEQVRRRRAEQLAADEAEAAAAARRRKYIGAGLCGAVVLLLGWGLLARSDLRDAQLQVERRRAQVINVLDRQVATERQWNDAPDSPDKHAELSGAENRVRVERKRYDEAVSEYQRHVTSLAGRVVATLGDYPEQLPMSSEIQGW